ncbi:MAG: ribosome small subunit-dependent GTPase A [Bacteroidetes bacterium]|jgi:ribosome biogenesis GTPase|nr:ribosome small subunit-dependent GTPase A [Bacteroidota bacterium]
MQGIVIKSTGSWYMVRKDDGDIVSCRIKGKFRLQGIKHTNPVTVGDVVEFEIEPSNENGVINKIHDRKNYIIRKANNLSKQTHIIAANIDQALLMVTLAFPKTSLGFIDRFLMTAEAYHIPATIVFNKLDLFTNEMEDLLNDTIELYQNNIGYPCIKTSVKNNIGLDEVKALLKGKTTLVSGHSGVGKSSLLNAIEPALNIKTGDISSYSFKGQHTTTFAEMHPLSFGGYIIDTPGIREFGLVDFDDREISHYFKEMKSFIGKCKFNNCKHMNEPGCSIIKAVEENIISPERYNSYLSIMSHDDIYE